MLLSAVSVLVVGQSSSEIPEGLMNNPIYCRVSKTNVRLERGKENLNNHDVVVKP